MSNLGTKEQIKRFLQLAYQRAEEKRKDPLAMKKDLIKKRRQEKATKIAKNHGF